MGCSDMADAVRLNGSAASLYRPDSRFRSKTPRIGAVVDA